MISYNVGDTIQYRDFGGNLRTVLVSGREENIKNDEPGFFGTMEDDMGVWGYDDQIVRVVSSK